MFDTLNVLNVFNVVSVMASSTMIVNGYGLCVHTCKFSCPLVFATPKGDFYVQTDNTL